MNFKGDDLISLLAKGEYPKKTVETKYGDFVVKYPSGEEDLLIARKRSDMFGGRPIDSFNTVEVFKIELDMTLAVVIETYPAEFPDKWKGDGIVNFPDKEVKNAIYKAFNTFFSECQKQLSGDEGAKS